MKVDLLQTNFTSGELSPKIKGRVDLSNYYNGAEKIKNFIVNPLGGIFRRSGTRFVSEVKTSSKKTILIPFQFSITQTYILEFGDQYIRFYKDEGQILSGGSPYEISTTFLEADLEELNFIQSADVLYIFHKNYVPKKLSRTGHTSWTIADLVLLDGPYLDLNSDSSKTLQPSGTTGAITITAAGHTPFAATDVGRLVRIKHSGRWGSAQITGFVSSTVVNATVASAFPFAGTTASSDWRLGAFSTTTGYPIAATFHEQRLFLGGNIGSPQSVYGSKTNNFEVFSPSNWDAAASKDTISDDNGLSYTLATEQVNAIKWFSSSKVLMIGTASAEFSLTGGTSGLTPSNVKVKRESLNGASAVRPIIANSSVLFAHRAGRKLFKYEYDFGVDAYYAQDLTLFAEHITKELIKEIYFLQQPDYLILVRLGNGELRALTFIPEQKVFAWSEIIIGGTDVVVESIASIPSINGEYDQLWLLVKRTINGTTKRYVEFLTINFDPDEEETSAKEGIFVDSSLTYNGAPASTISGLTHLIGETVQILADGSVIPEQEVSVSGTIELNSEYSVVNVGLKYESELLTFPLDITQGQQTALIKKKRIISVDMELYKSLGLKFGENKDKLEILPFRKTSDLMDSAPKLFTGSKKFHFARSISRRPTLFVKQEQPLPCYIINLVYELEINNE